MRVLIALALILALLAPLTWQAAHVATCYGDDPCRACRTCSNCKHCAAEEHQAYAW